MQPDLDRIKQLPTEILEKFLEAYERVSAARKVGQEVDLSDFYLEKSDKLALFIREELNSRKIKKN